MECYWIEYDWNADSEKRLPKSLLVIQFSMILNGGGGKPRIIIINMKTVHLCRPTTINAYLSIRYTINTHSQPIDYCFRFSVRKIEWNQQASDSQQRNMTATKRIVCSSNAFNEQKIFMEGSDLRFDTQNAADSFNCC